MSEGTNGMSAREMSDRERSARIRDIDADLARMRGEIDPSIDGPHDMVDSGQNLAAREELAGQIEELEAERERLMDGR